MSETPIFDELVARQAEPSSPAQPRAGSGTQEPPRARRRPDRVATERARAERTGADSSGYDTARIPGDDDARVLRFGRSDRGGVGRHRAP